MESPGTSSSVNNPVHREMQRSFPAIYAGSRKRKAPEPPRSTSKVIELQFCLQPENSDRTPKDETMLLQAGLGRRTVHVNDDADHTEITRVLLEEYPKLRNLRGGWLLQKAAGGSGQRKTTPLVHGSQGYTAKILKSSSNNGKNIIYIVPLQEKIDTTPLPYDSPEFQNMPKNDCMTCGTSVPLQLLPFHIESCQCHDNNFELVAEEEKDQEPDVICVDSCPICGEQFAAEAMALHASSCGESFPLNSIMAAASENSTSAPEVSTSSVTESSLASPSSYGYLTPGTSQTSGPVPAISDAWKRVEVPERAAILYRRHLLQEKEDEPTLKVRTDMREDVEDQEGRLISFYKVYKVDWARPLHCRLEGNYILQIYCT
ncbi:uncharacterized protein LOC116042047 [Sander lucioperca]|uniref:uncharacterized protein LOC116042047 n=1 Tax=Sander lucioperca TaxID=283035 RepID=UPI00125E78FF|nr:uncharacterized protein LOC116042047 [Sander lucioperca]